MERVQCDACGKWRRLPASLDGWPRLFYCALNTWEPRLATCDAAEEDWKTDMPMSGDVVYCELDNGIWLDGVVKSMPKLGAWATLPRLGMPQPDPIASFTPELWGQPTEPGLTNRVDLGASRVVASSRNRKQTQLYDASTSSTEYTRALRKRENEEEALRKQCVTVDFADGLTRCIRLEKRNQYKEWIFQREWSVRSAKLRTTHRPPAHLSAGRVILYRIDGKGWRKVTLLKRGMPAKLWQQLEGHGRLLDVLPRFEHAPAEHGACLKEECPHTKREDLGLPNPGCSGEPRVDGDKAAHISGGILSKTSIGDVPCHVAPPSAAPPDIAAAGGGGGGKGVTLLRLSAEEERRRVEWWQCSFGRTRLLLRLCEATRMVLWHAPADVTSYSAAIASEPELEDAKYDDAVVDVDDESIEVVVGGEEAALNDAEGLPEPHRGPGGARQRAFAGGASERKRKHPEAGETPPVSVPKAVKSNHTASRPDGSEVNVVLRLRRSSSS